MKRRLLKTLIAVTAVAAAARTGVTSALASL